MMSSDFYFRDKIPVAVMGVRNTAGQKLLQLLTFHPWFEIAYLYDSEKGEAVLPESLKNMPILSDQKPLPCPLIFSTLTSPDDLIYQQTLAESGHYVISCNPPHSKNPFPVMVAEINGNQSAFLLKQSEQKGGVLAIPQPNAIGLTLALKPLLELYGLKAVMAVALTSLNSSEENSQIAGQTRDILGQIEENQLKPANFKISLQGMQLREAKHDLLTVSVKFPSKVKKEELIQAWRSFQSDEKRLPFPNAAHQPLYYTDDMEEPAFIADKKMSIFVGQLSNCEVLDYKFSLSFDPLMRGIIGPMLLNAELLVAQGQIYW